MRSPHLTAVLAALARYASSVTGEPIVVGTYGSNAPGGEPLDGFVSFSIELGSFPDFAGNLTHPNTFSENLLNNIAELQGSKPYIRVGGNTQDIVLYNPDPTLSVRPFYANPEADQPTRLEIGPKFFDSFKTWGNTKFSFGFNLGGNNNSAASYNSTLQIAPLICNALGRRNLHGYEYGNEPDHYVRRTGVRNSTWNATEYATEWVTGTRAIAAAMEASCPSYSARTATYMGPSFAGLTTGLRYGPVWAAGINNDSNIKYFAVHNYISGATTPGVTVANTLLNHTVTKARINVYVDAVAAVNPSLPLIWGETNSLFGQGRPGVSNTFACALWTIDYSLYSISRNIKRSFMHQGLNYRYNAWQPVHTENTTIGTKAPYYGNIAVAAFLGDWEGGKVRVAHLEMPVNETEAGAAYAAYVNGRVRRVMLLNLREYNGTGSVNGTEKARPSKIFSLNMGYGFAGSEVGVRRLVAPGSNALSGVSWDGWSYNYELEKGKPVRLSNVTVGETVTVGTSGLVEVSVPDSQAVMLDLEDAWVL